MYRFSWARNIYEENLPIRIKTLKKDTIDRTDVAFKTFKENGILHLGHLENFLNHKKENQLYFKHDTHWNSFGAYLAYRAIINKLRFIDNEISLPLSLKDFSISIDEDFPYGDLIDFMGIDNEKNWFIEKAPRFKTSEDIKLIRKNNILGSMTLLIENRTIDSVKAASN